MPDIIKQKLGDGKAIVGAAEEIKKDIGNIEDNQEKIKQVVACVADTISGWFNLITLLINKDH